MFMNIWFFCLCFFTVIGAITENIRPPFPVDKTGTVYLNHSAIFILCQNRTPSVIRVSVSGDNISEDFPLLAVFKQQMDVLSFTVPLLIHRKFSFKKVSRTICPAKSVSFKSKEEHIIIEISSLIEQISKAPTFHLHIDIIPSFVLSLESSTNTFITPSEPQYFSFLFPNGTDSVIIKAHSPDRLCMTVSVQASKCPVSDLIGNVMYSGIYQTVSTLGTITVTRTQFNSEFFVVLVLKPDDIECGGLTTIIPISSYPNNPRLRKKNVTLTVIPTLAGYHYLLPIYGAVCIFLLFYVAAAIIILIYRTYDKKIQLNLGSRWASAWSSRRYSQSLQPQTQISSDGQLTQPTDDGVTRPRRQQVHIPEMMINPSTSTLYNLQMNMQHSTSTICHSIFSSSSEDEDLIRLTNLNAGAKKSFTRHLQKRRQKTPLQQTAVTTAVEIETSEVDCHIQKSHRRSVSYGSTRDLGEYHRGAETGHDTRSSYSAHLNKVFENKPLIEPSVLEEQNATDIEQSSSHTIAPPIFTINASNDIDMLNDAKTDRNVYLLNRNLNVSDLARKRYSTLNRKYLLYFWYLIIISIFYGLPVVQLVMTYQKALHDTGNEDMCYYNFECAHPLGVFTAFNNIISNVGYVLLGLLFLGLTARRDIIHRRAQKCKAVFTQNSFSMVSLCRSICAKPNWGALNSEPGPRVPESPEIVRLPPSEVVVSRVRVPCGPRRCITSLCFYRLFHRRRRSSSTCSPTPMELPAANILGGTDSHIAEEDCIAEGEMTFGIPQHYGLFYAMGLALTMEGVLSACYHICPSFSNFQFDTAYMYILALILMLKIYQTRHPDINASAHSAYMVMALVIFCGVTGVLYGGETFWVMFTVVFLIMSIWMTAEIYYMGQWNFDICLPRRLYFMMRSDGIQCIAPMYLERMVLLLVVNCVNIGMATFGLVTRPKDFSSFLLSIFMINLLMYFFFYVLMKFRYRERFLFVPLMYIILACLAWGSAIYFFIQHSTTWEVTPAQSRALNQPCILMGFYDVHDIWHFLSSISMFFSFMSIMTLDDDLANTPRHQIPVF